MSNPLITWAESALSTPPEGANKCRVRVTRGGRAVGAPVTVNAPPAGGDRRRLLARVAGPHEPGDRVRLDWLDGTGGYIEGVSATVEAATELDDSPLARLPPGQLEAVQADRREGRALQLLLVREVEQTSRDSAALARLDSVVTSLGRTVDALAGHLVKMADGQGRYDAQLLDRVAEAETRAAEAGASALLAEAQAEQGGQQNGLAELRGLVGDLRGAADLKGDAQSGALLARIVSRLADGHGVAALRSAVGSLTPDARGRLQVVVLSAFQEG